MSRSIVVIAPFLPYPPDFGGALRVYHLARELTRAGAEVIVLAPATRDEFDAIRQLGETCDVVTIPAPATARTPASRRKRMEQIAALVSTSSFLEQNSYVPRMQAALDRLFLTRRIDLIQYEFPQSALYRPARPVPSIFDAHNVEHDLLRRVALTSPSTTRSAFNTIEYRKVRRLEQRIWRDATVTIATSERDARIITSTTGRETPVIPNGVDLDHFEFRERQPGSKQIVFVGAMRHQPNADGAIWFATQVLPLVQQTVPDARFVIVGADPPPAVQTLQSPHIEVTGRVEDVRPYLATAALAVVPLFSGGGTRLKILEAFATGVPVISTTIGAEGIEAVDRDHLLLAHDPQRFADGVNSLLGDSDLAERRASSGRALVERQYGWSAIAGKLTTAHDLALERTATTTQ